jgi:hypothetical protein
MASILARDGRRIRGAVVVVVLTTNLRQDDTSQRQLALNCLGEDISVVFLIVN